MDHLDIQPHAIETILDLSRLVSSSLELSVVLHRILMAARDLSGADIVSVMMLDDNDEHLCVVAAHGLAPEVVATATFRLGEGLAGWAAANNQPVHLVDPGADPRYVPIVTPPDSCLFVLPLRARERTFGVLNLVRVDQSELFPRETVQMVEIFASHAAIAIQNAAAMSSLRYAATRERLATAVHLAANNSSPAAPAVRQILAELGATLEDAACALYVPAVGGGYTLLVAVPEQDKPSPTWQPVAPEVQIADANSEGKVELQIRVDLPDYSSGWLLVRRSGSHFLRRAERQLARFAADQVELLLRNERLVRQELRSSALSRTLSQLATASNAMVGQDSLLDFILEQLSQFIDYDSTGVFLFHDDEYARMIAGRGFRFGKLDVVLYMGPGSLTWDVQRERRAIYLPDVQLIPGWQPVPDSDVIRAWIGAPLTVNGRMIGVLTIDKWTPNAFTADDVQMAQLFADHVAVAINSQQLIRDAQLRAAQLQVVHQASEGLRAMHDLPSLLNEVARLLHVSFGLHQVYICLVDGVDLVVEAVYGQVNCVSELQSMRRYSMDQGLSGWAARHNRTLLVNNVATDSRYIAHSQTRSTQAELVAPISHAGRVLGVIAVQSVKSGVFGQNDVHLIEALASLTAMTMERIRREEELHSVQEQLSRNERLRALGELASGVAHDFNNLLTSILGHTQLLLAEQLAPSITEELQVIERAALDGAATVRRLQNFAQTSKSLPTELVWLGEVVEESLAITRPHWRDAPQSRGQQIQVVRELGELPPLAGDGPSLRELVMNLIINAVDAMPNGGLLRLRTELLQAEQSPLGETTARLLVEDSGVGMAEAVRQRIFEPFFTTKGARGTGMGLAMVYGIVQRHQGRIDVQSETGEGTSFEIYLPVRPVSEEGPVARSPDTQELSRLRVLIVDDDQAVRRVLVRQLVGLGHRVSEAASGQAALAHLKQERYDLLCSDLGMETMSGWELIQRARRLCPELLVVLVTGWGEQIDVEEARARGVDAVVPKPFDAARIQHVLSGLQARVVPNRG
jgi:signal transduction histidine kinase/ActR/RegA family two-component response regulator